VEAAGGTMEDITCHQVLPTKNSSSGKKRSLLHQCGLVKPEALVEITSVAHVGTNDPKYLKSDRPASLDDDERPPHRCSQLNGQSTVSYRTLLDRINENKPMGVTI
jgi:hypothetical protein